eukprot:1301954-Amorphochlora_amoeboformis.AAC.1
MSPKIRNRKRSPSKRKLGGRRKPKGGSRYKLKNGSRPLSDKKIGVGAKRSPQTGKKKTGSSCIGSQKRGARRESDQMVQELLSETLESVVNGNNRMKLVSAQCSLEEKKINRAENKAKLSFDLKYHPAEEMDSPITEQKIVFPYDLENDTAEQVASEMVNAFELQKSAIEPLTKEVERVLEAIADQGGLDAEASASVSHVQPQLKNEGQHVQPDSLWVDKPEVLMRSRTYPITKSPQSPQTPRRGDLENVGIVTSTVPPSEEVKGIEVIQPSLADSKLDLGASPQVDFSDLPAERIVGILTPVDSENRSPQRPTGPTLSMQTPGPSITEAEMDTEDEVDRIYDEEELDKLHKQETAKLEEKIAEIRKLLWLQLEKKQ